MKLSSIVGGGLLTLGIVSLAYAAVTYTPEEELVQVGNARPEQDQPGRYPISPWAGFVAIAAGLALLSRETGWAKAPEKDGNDKEANDATNRTVTDSDSRHYFDRLFDDAEWENAHHNATGRTGGGKYVGARRDSERDHTYHPDE
jgi:hypothetical protein